MEDNEASDSESEYEDVYAVLEIEEIDGLNMKKLPPLKLERMDSQTPSLTIGDYRFEGRVEPVVGTYAVFESSKNAGPRLVCNATEALVFDRAQRVMEIESEYENESESESEKGKDISNKETGNQSNKSVIVSKTAEQKEKANSRFKGKDKLKKASGKRKKRLNKPVSVSKRIKQAKLKPPGKKNDELQKPSGKRTTRTSPRRKAKQ